jgi:hypothetical protein
MGMGEGGGEGVWLDLSWPHGFDHFPNHLLCLNLKDLVLEFCRSSKSLVANPYVLFPVINLTGNIF